MAQDITFWLPMGFVIAGVLLYLWEMSQPGFFIAVPATVLIFLGVLGLIIEDFLFSIVAPIVALAVAIPTTLATLRVYRRIAPPSERPETTIGDSLVGRRGTITKEAIPEETTGKVRIEGVIWSARAEEEPIDEGTKVEVVASRGVHVVVRPLPHPAEEAASDEEEATGAPSATP